MRSSPLILLLLSRIISLTSAIDLDVYQNNAVKEDDTLIDVDSDLENDEIPFNVTEEMPVDDILAEETTLPENITASPTTIAPTNAPTVSQAPSQAPSLSQAPSESPTFKIKETVDLNNITFVVGQECQVLLDYTYNVVYGGDQTVQNPDYEAYFAKFDDDEEEEEEEGQEEDGEGEEEGEPDGGEETEEPLGTEPPQMTGEEDEEPLGTEPPLMTEPTQAPLMMTEPPTKPPIRTKPPTEPPVVKKRKRGRRRQLQPPGMGACRCQQNPFNDRWIVDCDLRYCGECNEDLGVCLLRFDTYDYGPTPNFTGTMEVQQYTQRLAFDPPLPFVDEQGDDRNWTFVTLQMGGNNPDNCVVSVVDDDFEPEDTCTCESVNCGNGDGVQMAFDCGGNQKWGYCSDNATTFDPNGFAEDNPLMAINANMFDWATCFDPVLEEDGNMTYTGNMTNATNTTNMTMFVESVVVVEPEEPEDVPDEAVAKYQPLTSIAKSKAGSNLDLEEEKEQHATFDYDEPLAQFFPSGAVTMRVVGSMILSTSMALGVIDLV